MKKLIIILLCLLLTGCTAPTIPANPEYRAFIVGVGKYENGWELLSPSGNATKLASLFSQCRFGEEEVPFKIIERLTDYKATKQHILNGILTCFKNADDDDVSYFYYMGHGGVMDDVPIILPTDYKHTLKSAITVHELEACLGMIAGTKVVFLETCHAGNFIDKSMDLPLDLINKAGYQVLTSSAGVESTYDSPLGSYFCNALIEGCEDLTADDNSDGVVSLSELYGYIKAKVTMQTVQIYPEELGFTVYEE